MKRFISLFLILLLFVASISTFAFAEDFSSRSDSDLYSIYNAVRNELTARGLRAENKTVIFDESGFQVYINGEVKVEESWSGLYLIVPVVIINNNTNTICAQLRDASVNGWSCDTSFTPEIPGGKKAKEDMKFELKDTDVTQISEFEDVEFYLHFFDWNDWMAEAIDSAPITIYK